MDIKGLLSAKTAGIPNAVIAAAGAVAIWFVFLRGAGASSASSGVNADSAYGLGYAQGLQAGKANTTPTVPGNPGTTLPGGTIQQPGLGRPGVGGMGRISPPPVGRPPRPSGLSRINPTIPTPHVGPLPLGRGGLVGSRSSEWSGNYFHPGLGRRVIYSHYVRAVGGPAAHDHEVARVSRGSGIHIARLRALNPVFTGRIRVH